MAATSSPRQGGGLGFGTSPVFLASISTILGAVLFLRLPYAVGHAGLLGTLLIILLGHLVTVPTALAIAEIATNRRVEGGGEYFIISRSFGTTIGGAIGIALYLSQAISVAFYVIAFAEAFQPLRPWFEETTGSVFDPRMISVPSILILLLLILTRGASMGVKALWVVVSILGLSLVLFFLGHPVAGGREQGTGLLAVVDGADPFFLVFAIVFPAFTGMTAGVGLSGDLANPRRSIPLGTLSATAVGMLVYMAIVVKLTVSATPQMLASDQLAMGQIALWGPIIPIGLACATVSSAIGSILVAPRTLQALAKDRIVPQRGLTSFLAQGSGKGDEPRNATLVTGAMALAVVLAGNVDFVARIISMFFMVTYGSLCAISFLEHFAARPSYRPTFRSKWYLSLLGALACLLLMLQMDLGYALLSLLTMTAIYSAIRAGRGDTGDGLAAIFRGVMIQATRYMQVRLQKTRSASVSEQWRPSIIMVNGRTFERASPLQFLNWLCYRHAVGTYLHFIKGPLDSEHYQQSQEVSSELAESRWNNLYLDTIVSPSMGSALAQSLQVPGISGMENNTVLFEFSHHDGPEVREDVFAGSVFAAATEMNMLVLRHGDQFFGARSQIDLWLTWHDFANVNLMVLLSYILVGNPQWQRAEIRILAAIPEAQASAETTQLQDMITTGRIPVSPRNLTIFPTDESVDFGQLVKEHSATADLVILGFTVPRLRDKGVEIFERFPDLGDVLFVCAQERIAIE